MQALKGCFHALEQKSCKCRLGTRGAEMVEYALVLACVCAVCALAYTVGQGTSYAYFKVYVSHLWENVGLSIKTAL